MENQWRPDGTHYQRTANQWLQNQGQHHSEIMDLRRRSHGEQHARLGLQRWRMFWMACAETFGYDQGRGWGVAHYRLAQPD